MKVAGIDTTTWEAAADDRGPWRAVVKAGMRRGEENRSVHEAVKGEKRKQKYSHPAHPPQPTIYICHKWDRDCHARVGLISHSRKCSSKNKTKNDFLLFWNIYLFLCRPLYRFFIPHFDLFIYFYFFKSIRYTRRHKTIVFRDRRMPCWYLTNSSCFKQEEHSFNVIPRVSGKKTAGCTKPYWNYCARLNLHNFKEWTTHQTNFIAPYLILNSCNPSSWATQWVYTVPLTPIDHPPTGRQQHHVAPEYAFTSIDMDALTGFTLSGTVLKKETHS